MLNFGNKEFRNLQEQVLENMQNIEKIEDVKIIGVDVTNIVDTVAEMEDIENPEQGDVTAVGTEAPFTLYVYYGEEWVSLGEFPRQGPQGQQGEQGIQGQVGPQGPMGPQGPQGPRGFTGPQGPAGVPGLRGPQGLQGLKGDPGVDGTVTIFRASAEDIEAIGEGYVDSDSHLQVCISLDPLTFSDAGSIKGPQGSQGIQGPKGDTGAQGPQGIQGIQGEQGPQGIQGPAGADGLTTQITVNGITYTQSQGNITLPNYPTVPINYITTDSTQSNLTGNKTWEYTITGTTKDTTYKLNLYTSYDNISAVAVTKDKQGTVLNTKSGSLSSNGLTILDGISTQYKKDFISHQYIEGDQTVTTTLNLPEKHGNQTLACLSDIPTVPVQDVTVGGASVLSGTTAVIPAIPDAVSGTNDGTNWTSLTIGSDTYGIGGGTVTDVQLNGTSILSSGVANILTNTAYNATTNKVATMSDIVAAIGNAIAGGY